MIVELVGYAAGFFTLVGMLPQVIKSYKTKSVEDVSFWMVFIFAASSVLWLVYGIGIGSWPLIVTDVVGFGVCVVQLGLMFKYKS